MSDKNVPAWLRDSSYEKLFLQGEVAQILSRPGLEVELPNILAASDVEPKLRVLAHELLIEAGLSVHPELVESYCQTLPDSFLHNWWGMPGQYLERLGHTVVTFGPAAIPCLTRLLDNRQSLGYIGSEEPTLSRAMQYRVCDLAAYLIATIIGIPYKDAKQTGVRDEFIAELRRRLGQ
jgi:hypothetical protein